MRMKDNIVDFGNGKQVQLFKRKEARVDAMRRAFRQAREEALGKSAEPTVSTRRKASRGKKNK